MAYITEVWKYINLLQGKRTQILMGLYALIELLHVFQILDNSTSSAIESILVPLAGATFAAKVSRTGQIVQDVIGYPNLQQPSK